MNSTTAPRSAPALPAGTPAAARTALKLLHKLQHGHLTVQLPDGTLQHFGHGNGPSAAITLKNWNVCRWYWQSLSRTAKRIALWSTR